MTFDTTVRNTDETTDFAGIAATLELLSQPESVADLNRALAALGEALRLPHYLMIELSGGGQEVGHVLHNAGAEIELSELLQTDVVRSLLGRMIPQRIEGGLCLAGYEHGLAVAQPHAGLTCLLVLCRSDRAVSDQDLPELMGLISMAVAYAVDGLRKLVDLACPLTLRELECLCHAAAGVSAKEVGRRLGISNRTVEEYIARCRKRLNAETTLAAAVTALASGWITHADIEALRVPRVSRRYVAGRR